jgi:hypothetical protein
VANNDEKTFKVAHQQAFRFLRGKLEEAIYNKTMQLQHKTVPHLLRFLRKEWNDGSAIDRARLRDEMEELTINKFTNYSEYESTFVNLCTAMEANGITDYADDESKLWRLIKGLDETWKIQIEVAQANEHSFTKASAYFQKVAKQDHSITGTMVIASSKSKRVSERVHFTDTTKQACIQHAKTGQCRFGTACKFSHGNTNTQGTNDGAGASDGRPFRGPRSGTNTHCSKCKQKLDNAPTSHKFCKPCYKETQKAQRAARQAKGKAVLTVQERQQDQDKTNAAAQGISIDGYCYATQERIEPAECYEIDPEAVHHAMAALRVGQDTLLMAMDSGATVGVVEDAAHCIDIQQINSAVKVGGQGRPTFVQVRRRGILPISQVLDGVEVKINLPVFIIPGFGISVFPLSFLLKRDMIITFASTTMEAKGPNGKVALRARALHHVKDSWLFYTSVRLDGGVCDDDVPAVPPAAATPPAAMAVTPTAAAYAGVAITHAIPVPAGEDEWRTVPGDGPKLPFPAGDVLLTAHGDLKAIIMRYHKRFGHCNYRDCAAMLGVSVPKDMPDCLVCKLAKSKRHALTGGEEPLLDPPRIGHTIAWDHAGPFRVSDWEGNNHLSLKICVKSGKLFGRMVKTTGGTPSEWRDFIAKLEAHFGRLVVARLLTDAAPYFAQHELATFNRMKGIDHIPFPAHTQELNGVCERQFGTLLAMTRAAMLDACTPERSFGLCLIMMIDTLNTMVHRSGGKLSRNEKWHNKILPDQHKNLGTWGCAAILHLQHGERGHVGGPGRLPKLDATGELCVLVGYGQYSKKVLRIKLLPRIEVYESAHVTLLEHVFPFKTKVERPISDFLSEDQRAWLDHGPESEAAVPVSRGRGRPLSDSSRSQRIRNPSAQALNNIPDVGVAPDQFAEAHYTEALLVDDVYGDVWATIGGAEELRDYYKLITQSPDREQWLAALSKEWQSHDDLKTMSGPIEPKDLPPGVRPIPFDLIGKLKRNGIYKCRAIVKGFHMREGIDFNQTFATVPCLTTLRFFFAMAARHDWDIWQGDVSTAFLAADMDTDLYMAVPNYFNKSPTGSETGFTIRKALKAIPGVPQGPRLWSKKSKTVFLGGGLIQSKAETCLYYNIQLQLFLIVWVDDLFLFAPTQARQHVDKLWKFLQGELILGDKEPIYDCLGVTVTRDRSNRKLWLSQEPAVLKLIKRAQLEEAKPTATPMATGIKLTKQDCPSAEAAAVMIDKQRFYRSVIASVIYIMNWTRGDVAYAVSKLCRFMHNPGEAHITALKRLLRYLHGTADFGLCYDFSSGWKAAAHKCCKDSVYGMYDAAHADCIDTYRSTGAYCFYYGGSVISWHTKLLPTVTTSTNHSEYSTAAKAAREARWLNNLLEELSFTDLIKPIDLYSDSKGAIAMTYNPVHRSATKHIALADHYVREQQEEGIIAVSYLDTESMIADVFTKPLGDAAFLRHRQYLVRKGSA